MVQEKGTDEPLVLDLVFTRHKEEVEEMIYNSLIGKRDHVLLEYDFIATYDVINENDNYKKNTLNCRKGNFEGLKRYFKDTNWERVVRW